MACQQLNVYLALDCYCTVHLLLHLVQQCAPLSAGLLWLQANEATSSGHAGLDRNVEGAVCDPKQLPAAVSVRFAALGLAFCLAFAGAASPVLGEVL
jgi:hypothetical protein